MNRLCSFVLLLAVALPSVCSYADQKSPKISDIGRQQLIRSLNAEAVFVKKIFPMGEKGLQISDGKITPTDEQVQQMIAAYGPAAKPGDRVRITNLYFRKNAIIFEINGGPVKKKKWFQRIEISGSGGGTRPLDPGDDRSNARGSFVVLAFKDYVPEVTAEQVRQMLDPVFDFNAFSVQEAYIKTQPPKIQQAIKNKQVLVGMDREMVMYAKGRPDKKHREGTGDEAYEEWIYGAPPQEVQFVRFVGDTVVRLEIMAVDGQKVVRTEPEINLKKDQPEVAQKKEEEEQKPSNAPSLMRPGEKHLSPSTSDTVTVKKTPGGQTTPTTPTPQPPLGGDDSDRPPR